MRIVLSGASGLIGGLLKPQLQSAGHELMSLVRHESRNESEVQWDPQTDRIDASKLQGIDAAVHLSGKNVAVRWNEQRKAELIQSRVESTQLLCKTLAKLSPRPSTLIAASAIGFYGERGDEALDEDSPPGVGFFPELCQAWESATEPARDAGIRVVNLRIGVVLSIDGGALQKMLLPFRLGLGGPIGSGKQYMSWIEAGDLVRATVFALENENLAGPVNAVAPAQVRQREFAKTLAHVLHRPAILPMPAAAVRLLFGEMGQTLLLGGAKVFPKRLSDAGYSFQYSQLEDALRAQILSNR